MSKKTFLLLLLALAGLATVFPVHAQLAAETASAVDSTAAPDSIVQITAEAEGLERIAPEDAPLVGTFWLVQPGVNSIVPLPVATGDPAQPLYAVAPGIFLVDGTGGSEWATQYARVRHRHPTPTSLRKAPVIATPAAAIEAQGNAVADLIEQVQQSTFETQMSVMASAVGMSAPSFSSFSSTGSGGGSGGGGYSPNDLLSGYDYGTNLWIAQPAVTNHFLTGIGSNTLADVQYEIQSRTNLAQTDWQSEGFILGSELNNWTPLSVAQNSRTNLFLRLRSWADSANVGIPDWWQWQYFGYVGINPYASPSGDGYSILYKYQNGLNPTNFLTPPAPANFVAMLSTNGTNVLLTWSPAQGSVTNYRVIKYVYNSNTGNYNTVTVATVGASATSYLNTGAIHMANDLNNAYGLVANYPGGNISDEADSDIFTQNNPPPDPVLSDAAAYDVAVSATLIRNADNRWQLMFSSLPTNVPTILLDWCWYDYSQDIGPLDGYMPFNDYIIQEISISTASLTNRIYVVPDVQATNLIPNNHFGILGYVRSKKANGEKGNPSQVGFLRNDAPCFVDGRRHLKQNLSFQLRAATLTQPNILQQENNVWNIWAGISSEYESIYIPPNSNYVESSIFHASTMFRAQGSGCFSYLKMDDLWPFTANYELHQSLYDPSYNGPASFIWSNNLVTVPAQPVLGISNPHWILLTLLYYWAPCDSVTIDVSTGLALNISVTNRFAEVAAYTNGGSLFLQSSGQNRFGLAYQNALVTTPVSNNPGAGHLQSGFTNMLALGGNTGLTNVVNFYSQTVTPNLQLVNYYFALVNTPGTALAGGAMPQPYPLPTDTSFASTNQTGLLIASVGQSSVFAGWQKYSLQNGYANKFAYLGQYFVTNAFLLDASGNTTTNRAGVLSPYGEFFPTQAGKAKLVTMPDIDSGLQATCTVSIVSLNVDANHDGNMDLSFFGQDQTSTSKPYVFWCNNNFDRQFYDSDDSTYYEDGVAIGNSPYTPNTPTADSDYRTANGDRTIPTQRDLEDFSRLWLTGVTTNFLTNLPASTSITLTWGNVTEGNPTIDVFKAAEADGGAGYLTNSTIASQQTNTSLCPYLGRLASGDTITLKHSYISPSIYWPGNHFIWCGVAGGAGQLTLSFKDGNGNLLGQASVWIQLKDIKQMYERWTVGDNLGGDIAVTAYPAQDNLTPGTTAFQYGSATTNTPYILFVHGWNMKIADKNIFAETAFRRLWWQGYQGRFGAFRWPTGSGITGTASAVVQHRNFDDSEFNAWKSGVGLKNMLTRLNILYPGNAYLMAHSMGNVVAGEALKLAGNSQLANTYVAMQGAIPAHAYDATAPSRVLGPGGIFDSATPNRYANYYTNGAPCYFNNSSGAGTYVNFFNVNDFALDSWQTDQNLKYDNGWNYNAGSGQFERYSFGWQPLNFPTNTYEIFAYCDEARCYALGAQANVGGAFQANDQINLALPPFSFSGAHLFHSLQFRSDNSRSALFWDEFLKTCQLKKR